MFCPLAIIWWMTDSTWLCEKPIAQISLTTCAVDICEVAVRALPVGGAGPSPYLQVQPVHGQRYTVAHVTSGSGRMPL